MDAWFKSHKSTLCVVGCLCLALVVLFWPVFFQGKVLVPGDIPNTDPFLSSGNKQAPAPQNPLLGDQIEQFYVWHSVTASALQADGHIPLWNPYIFTGQPLVANSQSSLFYPPNLLLHLLSPGKVATLRVLFNLLFAALFTFLFCRQLEISARGSFLAAVSFAFSGPLIVWVGFPLANVVACLPFLMWAGEKLLRNTDFTRTCLLGAGMGLSLLAGHPETTFQILAVFSLYFLARVLSREQKRASKAALLAAFLGAVLLGALISGIQLVPFLDFMQQSSTFARGGRGHGGSNPFYSEEWLANLSTAFTLWCPNFFGNPVDGNYIWPFSYFQNYNEQSVYFGLVPLALAGGALLAGSKRRPLIIIAALAAFCLTVAWRLPVFEAISHLPIFSMAPNKRLKLPFVFLAAVMAGYGYDAVLQHLQSRKQQRRTLYGAGGILLAALLLYLWIVVLRFTVGPTVPPESFRYLLLYDVFSFLQWKTFLPLCVTIAAIVCYLLALRSERFSRYFPVILIALTMVELGALGWGYNPAVKEADILPPAPAVEFIKKRESQQFRILTTDGFFYPNFGAVYGIADVAGYDVPVYQRYSDLYLGQGGRSFGGQVDSRQQWDPDWPLVDFLNVKYVISPRELRADKYREVYRVSPLKIYENKQALPRAFMVYDSELIGDRKVSLARMLKGDFDFRNKVILEEVLQLPAPGPPSRYSVEQLKFSNDEVSWKVTSEKPGILVMSDLFTPDWTVTVDDRKAKLYRANYAYRAVSVPQGSHVVTFNYAPLSYRIGAAMTWSGVIVLAFAALNLIRRRVTGRQSPVDSKSGVIQ